MLLACSEYNVLTLSQNEINNKGLWTTNNMLNNEYRDLLDLITKTLI